MADTAPLKIWLDVGDNPPSRLDKALSSVVPEELALSRSRLVALIKGGHLEGEDGRTVTNSSLKVQSSARYVLTVPVAENLETIAENIPLDVIFEDADLIVINKPSGMVVHPAPGSPAGTLVNALLFHCGDSLSGIGGTKRPGIVHRIDKDTSGLLVVAKTDAAHHGLSRQFADHSMERSYQAVVWGAPSAGDARLNGLGSVKFESGGVMRITAPLDRHPADRKKMAVTRSGGRHAVTRVKVEEKFADVAARVTCQLETGRTHQIRVHLPHVGHPLIGDPVYGRARSIPGRIRNEIAVEISNFSRQALHARTLGFKHPIGGEMMRFTSELPADMSGLLNVFRQI